LTGFDLKGKHATTSCAKCHNDKDAEVVNYKMSTGMVKVTGHKWIGLKTTCISCHKDYHEFGTQVSTRFGNLQNCQGCHNEKSFKENLNFNHNLDTRFKVDGKHSQVSCVKCHQKSDPQVATSDRIYHFNNLEKMNAIFVTRALT